MFQDNDAALLHDTRDDPRLQQQMFQIRGLGFRVIRGPYIAINESTLNGARIATA